MLVTVVFPEKDLFLPQDIDPTLPVHFNYSPLLPLIAKINDLMVLVSVELGATDSNIGFIHDGKVIPDLTKSFAEAGIKNGDMIVVTVLQASPDQQNPEVEQFRQFILNNPEFQGKLSLTFPEVLGAALNNSPRFGELLQTLQTKLQPHQDQRNLLAEKAELYRRLEADPFNPDLQKKIEELIQEENIAANMEHAMEYHPESFGQVHMLYVPAEINGHSKKIFVDCGAQTTIMMKKCAEECGITRLMDTRFAGIAKGVGEGRIIGRIHSVMIRLGQNKFLPCSLTILDGDGPDILLGLDMLKRHQMIINLNTNKLEIDDESIEFLPEHDLPK